MVFWSSSWHQAHIIRQAYTYNHTHTSMHIQSCNDVAHRYMKHCYEKLCLSLLVFAPASVQFSGFHCRISGLSACHLCSLPDCWSYLLPCSLQLAKLMFKMLVSAPATGGVKRLDCRIPGLPATRAIYEGDGWIKLNPCSLRLPPVQLTELIFKLLVFAPALGAVYQVNFKNVGVHLPPVQSSGLIVRFLVSACVTRAVYQSDGWIVGLCTRHPCSTRSRVRFCIHCHFTESMPPLSSRFFKPTPSWPDSIYHFRLCGCFFALVVFRLVRLRIVPFSVPCCPSYFCFGLRCACLNRFWLCVKLSAVTCCCLPTRFADQSFPPLSLLFFSPTMSWRFNMTAGFVGHVVLNGSHIGLSWDCSLCLAMLFVIQLFGRALRVIKQGMRRIQRCQFFRLPTHFADLVFAVIGFGHQFPLCANIAKRRLKNTKQTSQTSQWHWPNFLNMSKTQNKLLKHLKDTEQTSQTPQTV